MMPESTRTDPKKREVIRLLEFELERLRADELRPGWTRWALLAALGGVGWLLAERLFADIDWSLVALFWALGWIGFHTIGTGCLAILPQSRTPGRSRFAPASAQYGHGRVLTLVFIAQWGTVAAIVWSSPLLAGSWARILTLGLAGCSLLVQSLFLAMSFAPQLVALNAKATRATSVATMVLLVAWPVACLAIIALHLAGLVAGDLTVEVRVAGLLVAASYLVEAFSKTSQPRPLNRTLLELRRDLALGHIPLASAARQVDVGLRGMAVPDVFQEDVDRILGLVRDTRTALATSDQVVTEMVKLPFKVEDRDSSQSTLLEALTTKRDQHRERATEKMDEAKTAADGMIARANQVRPTAGGELNEFLKSLKTALEAERDAFETEGARYTEIIRKWNDGELPDDEERSEQDQPVH